MEGKVRMGADACGCVRTRCYFVSVRVCQLTRWSFAFIQTFGGI